VTPDAQAKEYYSLLALFYLITAFSLYSLDTAYTAYLAGLAFTPTGQTLLAATIAAQLALPLLARRRILVYVAAAGLAAAPLALYASSTGPLPAASTALAVVLEAYIAYHSLVGDFERRHAARAAVLAALPLLPAAFAAEPIYLSAILPYLIAAPLILYLDEKTYTVYLNLAAFLYTLATALFTAHTPPLQLAATYLFEVCGGETGYLYLISPQRLRRLLNPPPTIKHKTT